MTTTALTVADRMAAIPAFTMSEAELLAALTDSVFPGAKPESVKMVVSYCRANVLDPFLKPVYIVPMKVKTGEKDDRGYDVYKYRDVIMPGVGLYRIQASRTSAYAGVDEPEFGPEHTMAYKVDVWYETGEKKANGDAKRAKRPESREVVYPEWCRVTVYRMVDGVRCAFVALERWTENYATKSADTSNPNEMWAKRPFGQLAKCAEAQALRKAFPEVGAQPTAEEMEGKVLSEDGDVLSPGAGTETATAGRVRPQSKSDAAKTDALDVDPTTGEVTGPTPSEVTEAQRMARAGRDVPAQPSDDDPPAKENVVAFMRKKISALGLTEAEVLAQFKLTTFDGIGTKKVNEVLTGIKPKETAHAA